MKKILSILSTISLSIIISTNVIACKKPNENNKHNKLNEPTETKFIPQKPPENSDWKLIDNVWEELKQSSNEKWYIGFYSTGEIYDNEYWVIEKFNNIKKIRMNYWDGVYRWDGINEPKIPTINSSTGEIINWNEK